MLAAQLVARMDSGEAHMTDTVPVKEHRTQRTPRATRVRPLVSSPETQNYISAAPAKGRADSESASERPILINIEICRDSTERKDEPDGERASACSPDREVPSDASPAASPAAPPESPPPADPPPTYVREEQTSQCGVCDLLLDTRAACRDHMRQHQAKKVYFCPLCPAALMTRNALEAHETARHADSPLRPYGCGRCGETFPTPRFLRRHREAEHDRPLPCRLCRRTFRRREDLEKHQAVHSDQRPYPCNR